MKDYTGLSEEGNRAMDATPLTVRPLPGRDLIVYVDGFNLYHGLHELSGTSLLWLDLVALARSLRPRSNLVQVKYFTAPVLDDPGAGSRQAHYLKALAAHSGDLLTVTRGRYQRKEISCRRCGYVRPHYEEKETDVSIAVSLVADALTHAFQDSLLISADSDLVPAVAAVQERSPGAFVAAAFPPGRNSAHLKRLMPNSFRIGIDKIRRAQLPDRVTDSRTGLVLQRPDKWRRG